MRRSLLILFKVAVSALLLYLSLRAVNLPALAERLSRLDPGWIAASFLLMTVQVVILSFRWLTIVEKCGAHLPFAAALRLTFIASFFNQVLPSTVGGDAARVWMLGRRGGGWANAAYSVLIDRIAGIFALSLIVIACLPWTLNFVHDPIARTFLMLIGLGAVAGAIVFMAIGMLKWPLLQRLAVTRHLVEVSRTARRLCAAPRSLAAVAATSFTIHLLTVSATWCIAQSVTASVSFALLLFLIPPVLLVTTIPLSIAGWGVREGSMIVAFSYAGLAQEDGLIVSVLFGLTMFAVGAVGGIAWITDGLRYKTPMSPPTSEPGA